MDAQNNREIIVIGSSLGGIQALSALASELPADLPAAVLVVQHRSEDGRDLLAGILDRRGRLPAVMAEDGLPVERGRIYVAPPGRHMLLTERGIAVVFGPRENLCRPAIDPLFRTAAVHYRSRVIGVILTGLLGDGAAGLLAVARCGGLPLVQAPDDAEFPEMPRHALAVVADARAVPRAEMAALIARLARERAPEPPLVPDALRIEVELTETAMVKEDWEAVPSAATDFTCPECGGAIREIRDEGLLRYRCRVGHAYSRDGLVAAKDDAVEDALWVALQTLQERAQMLGRMARDDRRHGRNHAAEGYEERAREAEQHAERLRQFIARLKP